MRRNEIDSSDVLAIVTHPTNECITITAGDIKSTVISKHDVFTYIAWKVDYIGDIIYSPLFDEEVDLSIIDL